MSLSKGKNAVQRKESQQMTTLSSTNYLNAGNSFNPGSITGSTTKRTTTALFTSSVQTILFTDYEPFEKYKQTISFRNNDHVVRGVKVVFSNSRFFQVSPSKREINNRVAPGLEVSYDVTFSPEEKVDYSSQILVVTEQEQFTIPIRAIGIRAKLDLPTRISFPEAPVKYCSTQDVYIHNVGKCPASFCLLTQPPFSVSPNEISNLNIGEGVHITVSFSPDRIMSYNSMMEIQYHNGEIQTIPLDGEGVNSNVRLDTSIQELSETFIGEKSQSTFKIMNKSDIRVKYSWKLFSTAEDEARYKMRKIIELSHELDEGSRVYRKQKREIEANSMNFLNTNFSISPISGEIWPGMEEYITVHFHPKAEALFEYIAFCEVDGREDRLPIKFTGRGKGPDVSFSISDLNLGEVFVNSPQEYQIQLNNRGTIEARYEIVAPTSLFGNKIGFTPNRGILAPRSSQTITINFNCDIIGEFSEIFRWRVEGKTDELTLYITGQTVGPEFHFDVDFVDFGTVSFNFLNTAYVELTNTCEIPMNYRLRVPEDGTLLHREFDIIPATGTILPESAKKIRIDFLSNTRKRYNSTLVVDILDVGENLLSIPIRANCVIPDILLSSSKINYGDCFLGYTYTQTLDLGNNSNQPAKYEVIFPQDVSARVLCTVDGMKGVVPSNSTHKVKVSICTKEVGGLYIPLYVRIVGSEKPPFEVGISACAIGPIVELETRKIDWGSVRVLQPHEKQFKIINKSPIPAPFVMYFSRDTGLFSCDITQGSVAPGSELPVTVKVIPDEAMKFSDELIVDIENGEKISVKLIAIGKGSSICSSIPLNVLDFQHVFTSIPCSLSFTLTNEGRKVQTLQWMQVRRTKADGYEGVFKITPERISIPPKSCQEFTVQGCTAKEGQITEHFVCRTTGKSQKQIFETDVLGLFSAPLAKFSCNKIQFDYTYSDINPPLVQIQPLTISNTSPLPLSLYLKTSGPFSLDDQDYTIPVNGAITVNIYFNPNFRHDKISASIKTKLQVTYKDHPQKDSMDLLASINFPNLDLHTNTIDFGAVMNESERCKQLVIANKGTVDAYYNWEFHMQEEDKTEQHILNVFDIIPIKGVVKAGERAIMQIGFKSHSNAAFKCVAVCQVSGGPKYEVSLKGESSLIRYSLDSQHINYGIVPFYAMEEREIYLQNTGKVLFSFECDTSTVSVPGRVEVVPTTGKVKAGDKVRVIVKIFPGVPEYIRETFILVVAQCEPTKVNIEALALHPSVQFSLKQQTDSNTDTAMQKAKACLEKDKSLTLQAIEVLDSQRGASSVCSPQDCLLMEAERVLLCEYLQQNPISLKPKSKQGTRPHAISYDRPTSRASASSLSVSRYIEPKFVLARYVCEFGNTIKGTTKKRVFKINNTGIFPVSFRFDKKELTRCGLMVEPCEVKHLPGYPSYEAQSIELSFQSKNKKVSLGEYNAIIPMEVINGYLVEFEVKANVIVPDIDLSMSELKFGSVYVGFVRVITLQLANQKEIPCEWAIELPKSKQENFLSRNGRDNMSTIVEEPAFFCKHDKGALAAGERVNVEVYFVPNVQKKYDSYLTLRCSHNPKTKKIVCSGFGKELDVRVEPAELDAGPVLPFSDVDVPITVINNCDFAMDFFSVEFDAKNAEEEDMLCQSPDFDKGYILIPPRLPGDTLSKSIIGVKNESRPSDISEETVQNGDMKESLRVETDIDSSLRIPTTNSLPLEKRKILVIYGPPYSGKTTLATNLASRFSIPILSLDEIIQSFESEDQVEETLSVDSQDTIPMEYRTLERLQERIDQEDCRKGFIFDSLGSSTVIDDVSKASIILRACYPSNVMLVVLSIRESTMRLRELALREEKAVLALKESNIPQLSEEEYDQLSEEEKKHIEQELRLLRVRRSQIADIMKEKSELILEDQRPGLDIVSYIREKAEEDKNIRLQIEEEIKKKKKQKGKPSKGVPPTPEVQFPPSMEELNQIRENDTDMVKQIKVFRSSYLPVATKFEEGHRTEQEIEQERVDTARRKKRAKKQDFAEENTPTKVLVVTATVPIQELTSTVLEKLPEEYSNEIIDEPSELITAELAIPLPYTLQRIAMPAIRKDKEIKYFKVMQVLDHNLEKVEATRWTLRPNSSIQLLIRFCSQKVGVLESVLHFGVFGRKQRYKVKCRGICNYPEISTNERMMFPRRIKQRPDAKQLVSKRYVMNEKVYEFGPLLKRETYSELLERPDHANSIKYYETFNLTNNGLYDVELNLAFKSGSHNFSVEPKSLLIPKDQASTIRVWGLPRNIGLTKDTLICTIKDNPIPFQFDLQMVGAEPKAILDKQAVDFGRVLLTNNTCSEIITIKNICTIPIKWKLSESSSLSQEFIMEPTESKLDVGQTIEIKISFIPKEACVLRDTITIEVTDDDGFKRPDQVKLTIAAEAFNLEAKIDSEVNLGVVRVIDGATKTLQLSNTGKYDISFKFDVPPLLAKCFTFTPQTGLLETKAKGPTTVVIDFKPTTEKKLKNCTDISCILTDAKTEDTLGTTKLNINVEAVFSKFSITPMHGINFGPISFDKEKTRQLEITNDGSFPFTYTLFNYKIGKAEEQSPDKRPNSKNMKQKPNKKKDKIVKKELELGKFIIEPSLGEIPPNSREKINITFSGEGSEIYKEIIGIDISGRDTSSDPQGIQFDLQGESCMPGMTTTDFESIFEEQQIVPGIERLSSVLNQGGVFCAEDRVFHFGTIAAGKKVAEKIKIINPFKVPCNIDCSIKPRDATDNGSVTAFDVQPQKLFVPPHEHRYVTVYFEPPSLHTYSALLEAKVLNGQDPKTNHLIVEVRGDGSLPRVVIKQPVPEEGAFPILKFPRTLLGRRVELPISIQNEGLLSATIRFDVKVHPSIIFLEKSKEIVLNSKEAMSFTVVFEPKRAEKIETTINMVVLDNHFESTTFKILAEGYEEDITFDDMPNSQLEDSIDFGHCAIGVKKQLSFSMVNHSAHHVKYHWTSIPNMSISPLFGHLHARASQDISVTFCSSESLEYVNQALQCQLSKVNYIDKIQEWNERHKTVKWIQVDEEEERRKMKKEKLLDEENKKKRPKSRAKQKNKNEEDNSALSEPREVRLVSRRIEEVNPEPNIEVLQSIPTKTLKVCALSDYVQFELNAPSTVSFKLTKMFESRSHSFTLKNTGRVSINYNWVGDENPSSSPFSITPETGSLLPQGEESFTIKYSPLDVGDHFITFKCHIPNTKLELPLVRASGTSLCPTVHFELTPSDYLASGRRTSDSKGPGGIFGPLEKSTKVIEITSCGIKIRNTKRFYILNPTDSSYQFEWRRVPLDHEEQDDMVFTCATKRGIVHSGKKAEIVFEYVPTSLQTMESYWLFTIPTKKISIPFVVVGHAKEPELYLDTPRVNFQTVLVDKTAKKTITLINRERIPFSFAFEQSSFGNQSEDAESSTSQNVLSIFPTHGTIGAQEEMPIVLTFIPRAESSYNFTLSCRVRKKPTLLTCNVKGEGFKVHERLELESLNGKTILAPHLTNRIDFDRAQINEKKVKRVIIFNDGSYNFDFSWHHANNSVIQIEPQSATVVKRGRLTCDIIFNPTSQVNLENYKCVCKVTNGGTYVVYINASGTKPKIYFSFSQYDFGPSFLFFNGITPKTTILEVRNDDDKELSYETLYENSAHFEVEATATVLKPKEVKKIPITFKPREVKSHKEVITFEINGLYRVPVVVTGEGTVARVELWNPSDKTLNFGPLQVGDSVETTIYIVNRSKIPAEIIFPQEMYAQMAKSFVSISTKKEGSIMLNPKIKHPITIYFKPEARLSTWTHELLVQVAGRTKVLSTITGACQGIEVKLNTSVLSFGPIVRGTQVVQKVVLENGGDIGAKYHWAIDKLNTDFSIHPSKGFAPANGEITIEVTYSPSIKSKQVISDKIQCFVEELSQPLSLALNGSCKDKAAENSDKVQFKVNVRQIQKKAVKISNPSTTDWKLRPEIDNAAFIGSEYLEVPAGQTREYEIKYAPVRMTDGQLDYGTLFFPRPDGEAYTFSLVGESIEPLPVQDIQLELFAKEQHVERLVVENWLSRAQRFKVVADLNVKQPDYLKLVDYIDVPPFTKREYKYSFYAHKEGVFSGKVYFRNEQTNEFLFYNVTYTVKPAQYLKTLTFDTTVRQKCVHSVNIENPLSTETKLAIKCDTKDIITPAELVLPPSSISKCDVCYFPLSASGSSEYEERELVFSNNELGSYPFKLLLKALPTGPEKNIHFNVGIGGSMIQTIRFMNHSPVATEFTCKLETSNFTLSDSKPIKVQPGGLEGKEESIDVSYEPSQLGDCSDKLTISSKTGGEYVFLLFGHCNPPRPQGPFEMNAPNGTATITFKNVFAKKMDYKFTVDHDSFMLKPESASLVPKQKTQITVSFKNGTQLSQRVYGKLIVTPKDKNLSHIQWIYYLLGKTNNKQ